MASALLPAAARSSSLPPSPRLPRPSPAVRAGVAAVAGAARAADRADSILVGDALDRPGTVLRIWGRVCRVCVRCGWQLNMTFCNYDTVAALEAPVRFKAAMGV